ncbi:MAG: deoxyribose-phosphate aldolase [Fretibacterium sp.]|nr:deoxyribose-phosphate aldolase [Fretibacterium sp.]
MNGKELAAFIDHTVLKADATPEMVKKLCDEAREWGFASVCVNSCYVPLAVMELAGCGVKVCTVVGFPLGAMAPESKAAEAACAVKSGASEVDMVLNVGWLKAGADEEVLSDIAGVRAACPPGVVLKVILETCLLTDGEKERACLLAKEAGADFVKTSTGFSTGGATTEDVALMRRTVGDDMGVKASGGVRTRQDALAMIGAGANRIGASAGVAICTEV